MTNRQNDWEQSIQILDEMDDDELRLPVIETRMVALRGLERFDDAVSLGQSSLQDSDFEDDPETAVRISALAARIQFESGESTSSEARDRALALLRYSTDCDDAMWLLRHVDKVYSKPSTYYRVLVQGQAPSIENVDGYFVIYDVVADSPESSLRFIEELEALAGHGNCRIDEVETIEDRPKDLQGVYSRSGRTYFVEDEK